MSARRPTSKQVLRAHISEMHRGRHRPPPPSLTEAELAQWHGRQHHRHWTNHYHEGVNLGPDARPAGWRTGEGAVAIASATRGGRGKRV